MNKIFNDFQSSSTNIRESTYEFLILIAGCWIAAIAFHPQYPQLWQKLSKNYGELLQENLQKLCLNRAKRLTASFDKNLPESFVKNTYNDISTEKSNQDEDEDDGFNDLGQYLLGSIHI